MAKSEQTSELARNVRNGSVVSRRKGALPVLAWHLRWQEIDTHRVRIWAQFSPEMATVRRTLERGWQWEERQCSHYHQCGKVRIFLQPQKAGC